MNLSKRIEKIERSNLNVYNDVFQELEYQIINSDGFVCGRIRPNFSEKNNWKYFDVNGVMLTKEQFDERSW